MAARLSRRPSTFLPVSLSVSFCKLYLLVGGLGLARRSSLETVVVVAGAQAVSPPECAKTDHYCNEEDHGGQDHHDYNVR